MRSASRARDTWFAMSAVLLGCFVVIGSTLSVQSGVTIDDATEQQTFQKITGVFQGLLHGDVKDLNEVQSYSQRYYGIGFYVVAYPIQRLSQFLISRSQNIDQQTAVLLARRPAVMLLFAISVWGFYRCTRFFVRERLTAAAFAAAYALCPYLLGHAMINIKDSPFMSVYLICTYLSIRIGRHVLRDNTPSQTDVAILAIATAALVSIRIPGMMILVQYLFTFGLIHYRRPSAIKLRARFRWSKVARFGAIFVPLVLIAYPALWHAPLHELSNALLFMGWLPQPGCTLTWGQCMPPVARPQYLAAWFAVKVPVAVLIGTGFVPFACKRVLRDRFETVSYSTLLFGFVYVLVVITVLRARLYDETRQLLFIYPLLFILAFVGMYLINRGVARTAVILSIAIFVWDDVRLSPYQYIYFNEAGRFLDVNQLFETDYWGISAREQMRLLEASGLLPGRGECLYADPFMLYRPFASPDACIEPLESAAERPPDAGFLASITCSPNRIVMPTQCEPFSSVTRSLLLSNRKLNLSVAYYCAPR